MSFLVGWSVRAYWSVIRQEKPAPTLALENPREHDPLPAEGLVSSRVLVSPSAPAMFHGQPGDLGSDDKVNVSPKRSIPVVIERIDSDGCRHRTGVYYTSKGGKRRGKFVSVYDIEGETDAIDDRTFLKSFVKYRNDSEHKDSGNEKSYSSGEQRTPRSQSIFSRNKRKRRRPSRRLRDFLRGFNQPRKEQKYSRIDTAGAERGVYPVDNFTSRGLVVVDARSSDESDCGFQSLLLEKDDEDVRSSEDGDDKVQCVCVLSYKRQ